MAEYQNIAGQKINRLTVLDKTIVRNKKRRFWFCRCECGTEKWINSTSLLSGNAISCGCYHSEAMKKRMSKPDSIKRGRIFSIYTSMRSRCYNPKANNFYLWGGKGIKVCNEWKNDFASFREWALSNGYNDGLCIDRIDSTKNYEPSNCRWITHEENSSRGKMNIMRVRLVRKLHSQSVFDDRKLAKIYGIGLYSMRSILNKTTWATI